MHFNWEAVQVATIARKLAYTTSGESLTYRTSCNLFGETDILYIVNRTYGQQNFQKRESNRLLFFTSFVQTPKKPYSV